MFQCRAGLVAPLDFAHDEFTRVWIIGGIVTRFSVTRLLTGRARFSSTARAPLQRLVHSSGHACVRRFDTFVICDAALCGIIPSSCHRQDRFLRVPAPRAT